MQEAIRVMVVIQRFEIAAVEHFADERVVFFFGTGAPMNSVWLRMSSDLRDPVAEALE